MDLVINLVKEIKEDINNLKPKFDDEEWNLALEWFKTEYSRYMITTSDAYTLAAKNTIKDNLPWSCFQKIIIPHLGKYGATQAIFRAFSELSHS